MSIQWSFFITQSIIRHITYNVTFTNTRYKSDYELTKDIPYLVLLGELWSVFCEISKTNDCVIKKVWLYFQDTSMRESFHCRWFDIPPDLCSTSQDISTLFTNARLCLSLWFVKVCFTPIHQVISLTFLSQRNCSIPVKQTRELNNTNPVKFTVVDLNKTKLFAKWSTKKWSLCHCHTYINYKMGGLLDEYINYVVYSIYT